MYELDQVKVGTAMFESRGPKDDKRDRDMLDVLRATRAVSPELRITHVVGPKEALLWVADAVCGAMVRHRTGDQSLLKAIQVGVDVRIVQIDPR